MAQTPAQRQQRHRDRLAALRAYAAAPAPDDGRYTRQEAWDAACETLQLLVEDYRIWRATTPAPAAAAPRLEDLHRIAGQVLGLAIISYPVGWGTWWHLADAPTTAAGLDYRSLREQLLSASPRSIDPDQYPRSAADDATSLSWWATIPPDYQPTWLSVCRTDEPIDVWYILRGLTGQTPGWGS